MGIFDFFKSEKPQPVEPTLDDMEEGFIVQYDYVDWKVKYVTDLLFDDKVKVKEYHLESGDNEDIYVEKFIWEPVKWRVYKNIGVAAFNKEIGKDIMELMNGENPPSTISYETIQFYLDSQGYGQSEHQFMYWEYINPDGKGDFIRVEQWDDDDFCISKGSPQNENSFAVYGK